jgi:hypothetical protein
MIIKTEIAYVITKSNFYTKFNKDACFPSYEGFIINAVYHDKHANNFINIDYISYFKSSKNMPTYNGVLVYNGYIEFLNKDQITLNDFLEFKEKAEKVNQDLEFLRYKHLPNVILGIESINLVLKEDIIFEKLDEELKLYVKLNI